MKNTRLNTHPLPSSTKDKTLLFLLSLLSLSLCRELQSLYLLHFYIFQRYLAAQPRACHWRSRSTTQILEPNPFFVLAKWHESPAKKKKTCSLFLSPSGAPVLFFTGKLLGRITKWSKNKKVQQQSLAFFF